MSDERDSARPEARILRSPWDFAAKLGREFAVYGGYVDPDLLKDTPAHDRDRPTTAALPIPLGALEAAGSFLRWMLLGIFVLDRLECGANPVAQLGEPCLAPGAVVAIWGKCGGNVAHCGGRSPV